MIDITALNNKISRIESMLNKESVKEGVFNKGSVDEKKTKRGFRRGFISRIIRTLVLLGIGFLIGYLTRSYVKLF